jgi:hypothetical protein
VLRVTRATSNVVDQQNVGVIVELEEFVSELNSDLESEYRSIVQYVQHAAVIKGAEHPSDDRGTATPLDSGTVPRSGIG